MKAVLLLVIIAGSANAMQPFDLTSPSQGAVDLTPYVEFAEASYDSVTPPPAPTAFVPLVSNLGKLDDFRQAYWFRVRVNNPSDGPITRYFELSNRRIAHLEFVTDDVHYVMGLSFPAAARPMLFSNYVAPLTFPASSTTEVLIYAKSRDSMRFPLRAFRPDDFAVHASNLNLLMGIGFAMIFAMALYNAMIFVISREKAYLRLALLLASVLFMQGVMHGYGAIYLWPGVPALNRQTQDRGVAHRCADADAVNRADQ